MTAPPQIPPSSKDVAADPFDYVLPCEVKVAPGTIIGKGCSLRTLVHAIAKRTGQPDEHTHFPVETTGEPQWIVNDLGELGVLVDGHAYFLYKGGNIEYETGQHDDGTPMLYRIVGKREFGEVCYPLKWLRAGRSEARYTENLVYTPGLSFGKPEDGDWRPLPSHVKSSGAA